MGKSVESIIFLTLFDKYSSASFALLLVVLMPCNKWRFEVTCIQWKKPAQSIIRQSISTVEHYERGNVPDSNGVKFVYDGVYGGTK